MAIEFMPWYGPNEQAVRCGGDDGCGALVMQGDTELHQKWHEKIWPTVEVHLNPPEDPHEVAHRVQHEVSLRACKDPDCDHHLRTG